MITVINIRSALKYIMYLLPLYPLDFLKNPTQTQIESLKHLNGLARLKIIAWIVSCNTYLRGSSQMK